MTMDTTARAPAAPTVRPLVTLAVLGLIATSPAAVLAADLGERLEKGEIVATSVPGVGVRAGRAVALVAAPPRVLRDLLSAMAGYPTFVPQITASRQVKPNRFVMECEFPWPVNKTWAYVQVQSGSREGAEVVTWKMLNGTLKSFEGVAWIQPWGKGQSLLTYQMLAVPHTVAPDGLMTGGLRDAVKEMVEAVRKQAARVLAANPGLRVAAEPSTTH